MTESSEEDKPKPSPRAKKKSKPKSSSERPRKRKTTKTPDSNSYNYIRKALEDHLIEYATKHNKRQKTLDEVQSNVEEFLDTFIILGYDYEGDPVTLISASTQQKADSISTLLQKFIVKSGPSTYPE